MFLLGPSCANFGALRQEVNFRHLFRLLRDELEPRALGNLGSGPRSAVSTRKDVYI